MFSFCYVDRQKSSVGSSEKSQVVHSANWKEQVHLKKELELLRRQENEAIKRIISEQRLITHKFLHRIFRSIDQIKAIEKMKDDLEHANYQRLGNRALMKPTRDAKNNNETSCSVTSNLSQLGSVTERPTSGYVKRTECKRRPRPVTASELQGRAWERKIGLMAKNIQRAKSASDTRI